MKHWTILLFFLIILGLVGCSHLKPLQTQSVEIAQGVSLQLMSPATLGISQAITQSVTIKHANEEHNLLAQIEIDSDSHSLIFVGMTPLGNRLFSIEYRANRWHYEVDPMLQDRIKLEYLLADFQLSYWFPELLQQRLSGGILQLEAANRRAIYRDRDRDGKKLIDIRYDDKSAPWKGRLELRHLERHYSVFVETLSVEKL
jgi:hypothetical protein